MFHSMWSFRRTCPGLLATLCLVAGCKDPEPIDDRREDDTTLDAAWGITYLTGYLLNEYVAKQPTGTHDVAIQCSRGGSIRITGTTGYDTQSAIFSTDLTYDFAGAHASVISTNLSVMFNQLTGAIRQTGAIRSSGDPFEDTAIRSTGLVYNLTVDRPGFGNWNLADGGPYDLHIWTATNELGQVYRNATGELDSVAFSWSYSVTNSDSVGESTNTYGIYVEL